MIEKSRTTKKTWNKPTLQSISVKKTKGGGQAWDPEEASYSPGS